MSSRWELDDGIKSIKSAWQREHTARANLEKMFENAEAENAKLRELVRDMFGAYKGVVEMLPPSYAKNVAEMAVMDISDCIRELGVDT